MHARRGSLASVASDGSTASSAPTPTTTKVPNPVPIYLPRADAILVHRQLQLHQREHTYATAHGHVPIIPLPHPTLVLEDTLRDFDTSQKHGGLLWPIFEFMRLKPTPRTVTQEQELAASGYGLGAGHWGRGVEPSAPLVGGGIKAQQAAAVAAALAAARSRALAKESLRPLALPDHANDDATLQPGRPTGPLCFFHPPPPISLLDAAIPHTVIYEDGRIVGWYFSSSGEDGKTALNTVLKKKKENCTPENVVRTFLETSVAKKRTPWQSTRDLDVVAIFHPRTFNESHQVLPVYLSRLQLERFVTSRCAKLRISGVLQSFVAPAGTYNKLLRAEWTPASCTVLERTAGLPIENARTKGQGNDVDSRITTFERNWQVALSEGALVIDEDWTDADRRRHEEEYLDLMLQSSVQSSERKGDEASGPAGKDGHEEGELHLATTVAYNEHRMTQIECLDQELKQRLNSYAWCLADHLRQVLTRHVRGSADCSVDSLVPVLPVKLTLYFKLGANNRLFLLFCDELCVSQGAPKIMDRLAAQQNDPTRDHFLKLVTPPQPQTTTTTTTTTTMHTKHARTSSTAAQELLQKAPIISPTTKRAAFNARMNTREWLRYKWAHWQGEYDWNRTLAIIELHRDSEREAAQVEAAQAAFFSMQRQLSLTSQPANVFKRMALVASEEARKDRMRAEALARVPSCDRPGTSHTCTHCRSVFELSSDATLSAHQVAVQPVLFKLVAGQYLHGKTPPSIWWRVMSALFPAISEDKCRQLLRTRKWYTNTRVTLCDACWEELHELPRVAPPTPESLSPPPATLPSLAAVVQNRLDRHHRAPRGLELTDEMHNNLDELLREYLLLPLDADIFFDDASEEAIQAQRRKEIAELHQASAYSHANARYIATGMGDAFQHLHLRATESEHKEAAPSASATATEPDPFEVQHQARAQKLARLDTSSADAGEDPARALFPGLDGSPLFGPTPVHARDLAHIPSPAHRSSSSTAAAAAAGSGESLAARHRQLEFERTEQALASRHAPRDREPPPTTWSFLENTKLRERESAQRVVRRQDRRTREEEERTQREAGEKVRLVGVPHKRHKWSERFRAQWLEKVRAEAEAKAAEREASGEEDASSPATLPFPLLASAGSKPRFPTPDVVAHYIRTHGLPESYIAAYERSYVAVLEPVTAQAHAQEPGQQRTPTLSRSSSASGSLPPMSPTGAQSAARSSRSSSDLAPTLGGMISHNMSRSQRIYNSLPVTGPRALGPVTHPRPWDMRHGPASPMAHTQPSPLEEEQLIRRPETSIGGYRASSARYRSPPRGGGGALREDADPSQQLLQSWRGEEEDGGLPAQKATLLPYLTSLSKSPSTPVLGSPSGPTTFGNQFFSPSRVSSDSSDPPEPISPSFAPRPGTKVYAAAVAEYLSRYHIGYAHADALRPTAQYISDKKENASLPAVGKPSSKKAPKSRTTATSRAREQASKLARPAHSQAEEKEASPTRRPPTASGPATAKSTRSQKRPVKAPGAAAGSSRKNASLLSHSPKELPALPARDPAEASRRRINALQQLHAFHRRDGAPCTCADLLSLIKPVTAPPSAERAHLESWLAEHESPMLAAIHEADSPILTPSLTGRDETAADDLREEMDSHRESVPASARSLDQPDTQPAEEPDTEQGPVDETEQDIEPEAEPEPQHEHHREPETPQEVETDTAVAADPAASTQEESKPAHDFVDAPADAASHQQSPASRSTPADHQQPIDDDQSAVDEADDGDDDEDDDEAYADEDEDEVDEEDEEDDEDEPDQEPSV